MRKILTLLLAMGLMYSCNTGTEPANADAAVKAEAKAKAEKNIKLVEAFMEAFVTGEVEKWRDLCSSDFLTLGPGIKSESTLEEYIEIMAGVHEATDSLRTETIGILPYTVEEGDMAGDYVFWWGTNSSYFVEIGKSATVMIHTVYRIDDGKISWNADYWDTGDLQQQLSDEKESKEK